MRFARSSALHVTRLCLNLLAILTLALCSGCAYSIDDQFALSRARTAEMADQLQFSFKLDPESVPIGQDIFFVATLTNTTDQPIVFREPRQNGVLEQESYDNTLLFSVEPISEGLTIRYPLEQAIVDLIPHAILQDEFVSLPPHSSREVRLELPHLVRTMYFPATIFSEEYSPLPVGQYRVHMTYYNDNIGYQIEVGNERRYVDLNAWVGKIEANPVVLTITSGK